MGGGKRSDTRKRKQTTHGGGNDPTCGCDMQAGWPKVLTENIPLPTMKGGSQPTTGQRGGASCGIPPIPNYYQGGGSCGACAGLPLPTPLQQGGMSNIPEEYYGRSSCPPKAKRGGGQPTYYNSNPVPGSCPFPGTGYCNFYARGGKQQGGANYGEPMVLQARLRGGKYRPTKKNRNALKRWRKGESIGFTMTSSLKAKGLIPRTSRKYRGKRVVSAKYA